MGNEAKREGLRARAHFTNAALLGYAPGPNVFTSPAAAPTTGRSLRCKINSEAEARVQLETGLVAEAVRHHREDLLHERQVGSSGGTGAGKTQDTWKYLVISSSKFKLRLCDVALGVP